MIIRATCPSDVQGNTTERHDDDNDPGGDHDGALWQRLRRGVHAAGGGMGPGHAAGSRLGATTAESKSGDKVGDLNNLKDGYIWVYGNMERCTVAYNIMVK